MSSRVATDSATLAPSHTSKLPAELTISTTFIHSFLFSSTKHCRHQLQIPRATFCPQNKVTLRATGIPPCMLNFHGDDKSWSFKLPSSSGYTELHSPLFAAVVCEVSNSEQMFVVVAAVDWCCAACCRSHSQHHISGFHQSQEYQSVTLCRWKEPHSIVGKVISAHGIPNTQKRYKHI